MISPCIILQVVKVIWRRAAKAQLGLYLYDTFLLSFPFFCCNRWQDHRLFS